MNLALIIMGAVLLALVLFIRITYKRPPQNVIDEINEDKRKHNPRWWEDERNTNH